jgi:hypothetical protein
MFSDGLRAWLRGEETDEAEAAGLNVAELLNIAGFRMTEGKWGK